MRFLSLILIIFFISFCASQKPPTGGLGDQIGPVLVGQFPDNATTNFDGDQVQFYFNEFINRSTVIKALNIEPDLGIQTRIRHGRKSFSVQFEEALPPNTTVIVQIGSDLTDTFNNKLGSPSTIAFSTGPNIDKGALSGAIYSAETGKGEAGLKVLLFNETAKIGVDAAKYTAQTDTAGIFQFDYLAEGYYTALWVEDNNRNRNLEEEREYYSAFESEKILVKTDSVAILPPLYITKDDTVAPVLYETGLLTQQRLNLMFSEDVFFDERTAVQVEDSTGAIIPAVSLYTDAEAKQKLLVHTQRPLADESMRYRVIIDEIFDEASNRNNIVGNWFDGSTQRDTVQQRIIAYGIKKEYFFDEPLKFRYAKPFTSTALADSFFVNAQSEMFKPWEKITQSANELIVYPDSLWDLEGLTFNLWDPSALSFAAYNPTIWTENKLGSILLDFPKIQQVDSLQSTTSLADSLAIDSTKTIEPLHYQIRVYDENMKLYYNGQYIDSLDERSSGNFLIDRLPAKPLRLAVFLDKNENGLYDLGNIAPFSRPEPYFLIDKVDIRSGFETSVKVDFSLSFEKLVAKLKAKQHKADEPSESAETLLEN